jgi:hypothetical protein
MSRYVLSNTKPRSDVGCFDGNCASYIEDLKRQKGPDADQPYRIAVELQLLGQGQRKYVGELSGGNGASQILIVEAEQSLSRARTNISRSRYGAHSAQ